jgi:hypothetical protein
MDLEIDILGKYISRLDFYTFHSAQSLLCRGFLLHPCPGMGMRCCACLPMGFQMMCRWWRDSIHRLLSIPAKSPSLLALTIDSIFQSLRWTEKPVFAITSSCPFELSMIPSLDNASIISSPTV